MSEEVECDICGFLNDCRNCAIQQARIEALEAANKALHTMLDDYRTDNALDSLHARIEALEQQLKYAHKGIDIARGERDEKQARIDALEKAATISEDTSDGYHTFKELYEYRMLYNAHAAIGWLAAGYPVVKSWRHSDGELCFGGGWFVVAAVLPTGQVTNHYEAEYWELFQIPEEEPPEYDGHTPKDVADRLMTALLEAENE